MDFKDMLKRANLNTLEDFLFHGGEFYSEPSEKTYAERIKEADRKISAFFEQRYPNIEEYDEIAGYYYRQADVYREVYFEIGLIAGAKIAYQIAKRTEELS